MSEKKNSKKVVKKVDSDESVERLDPLDILALTKEEVDIAFTDDREIEDSSIDHLFQEDDKKLALALDNLFDEDRKSFQKDLHDEVQKALSQPEMSKASLFRMRMKEPTETALSEEIAKQKTVEEIWEEPDDESSDGSNRKSIIVMCVLIALLTLAGGWALWQSANDQRGNEESLAALENESKQIEESKRTFQEKIIGVSELINRYLSGITMEQKSECIYLAESLIADIEAYYESNGGAKAESDYAIENILPLNLGGIEIWQVCIRNELNLNEELRKIYVRKNAAGEYKVDWKADLIFQENNVKAFIEKRSNDATAFRFMVEPLYNMRTFNWGFEEALYDVVRLVIPNTDIIFWGYIRRGSEAQKKMYRAFERDIKNSLLDKNMKYEFILKIKFLVGSPRENDQYVLIDDVVSRKWININE